MFVHEIDYDVRFENGVEHFQMVFKVWMDRNKFSHPGMAKLAKSNLNGASWLHSSQISGLRHSKLKSPGPKVFAAISHLNRALHEFKTDKKLIPGTGSSNEYFEPFCLLLEDGSVPASSWWYSLFIGETVCETIDFSIPLIDPSEANNISRRIYKLINSLASNSQSDVLAVLDSYCLAQNIDPSGETGTILDKFLSSGSIPVLDLPTNLKYIAGIVGILGGPDTTAKLLELVE